MIWFRYGALFMFLGIILGAFGGHGLKHTLSEEAQHVYHIGVLYHLIHAIGLLAVGWLATLKPAEGLIRQAGWAFVIGIVLFSGSLYLLSITGVKKLGMITPLGGLSFLAGWLLLALAAKP